MSNETIERKAYEIVSELEKIQESTATLATTIGSGFDGNNSKSLYWQVYYTQQHAAAARFHLKGINFAVWAIFLVLLFK